MRPRRARARKVSAESSREDSTNAPESPSHTSGTSLPANDSVAHRATNASPAKSGTRDMTYAPHHYKYSLRTHNAAPHPKRSAAPRAKFPPESGAYLAI